MNFGGSAARRRDNGAAAAGRNRGLHFAFGLEEARLRRVPVRCIHGWIFRPTFGGEGLTGSFVTELLLALEHDAKNLVERIVTEVAGETPDVELTCAAAEGPPAQVLLEAAADAYGGFAGLLLGSVSKQCARHAPCPVVIVRGRQEKGLL